VKPAAKGKERGKRKPGRGPWFQDGIRFACTACGNCCRNHGEGYDYVYSTMRERRAIAAHLQLPQAEFERRYCEDVDGLLSFKSAPLADGRPGKGCIFLEGNRCSIYAVRPTQCRTFPFWPEVLADREVWRRDVESVCPGVGTGPVHDLAEIRETVERQRAFEPD